MYPYVHPIKIIPTFLKLSNHFVALRLLMDIIQAESKVIETVIPLELVCPLNLSNKNLAATFNSWCTHPFIVRTCLGHPPF